MKYDGAFENNNLTAGELVSLMYKNTKEDGSLSMPAWDYRDEGKTYGFTLKWDAADCDRAVEEVNALIHDIEKIATEIEEKAGGADEDREEVREILEPIGLYETWNTYLRQFDTDGFDNEEMWDISERKEIADEIDKTKRGVAEGKPLNEEELEYYESLKDVEVSEDELKRLRAYNDLRHKQSQKRVGGNILASDLVIEAMKLYKLLLLEAPGIIVGMQKRIFAACYTVHNFGTENGSEN